jgi:hypothetical protein
MAIYDAISFHYYCKQDMNKLVQYHKVTSELLIVIFASPIILFFLIKIYHTRRSNGSVNVYLTQYIFL